MTDIPDTLALSESSELVKELWVLPRKTMQKLLHELQDEKITANSLLSNGWSAGTFCMTYVRFLFIKKNTLYR